MEVKHRKQFPNITNYSIEWGYATWTKNEPVENRDWSIRNRYENSSGGFNIRGSSEIPWGDFNRMIVESIKEDQFSNKELKLICKMTFLRVFKNIVKR